jgi:hypothetical protein
MGAFADWQPKYARHRVATFPVTITESGHKKPNTVGYLKTGLKGSEKLALKFPTAESFGFACGPYSRICVIDMDDTDPRIVAEGERLFGVSPLLWRTGGGKYAMPFRHNGERRHIRPITGLPIDVLGGGFVVAPPSLGALRPYEIIRGALDDLDRLPRARMPAEIVVARGSATTLDKGIREGQRNTALFKHCRSIVDHCQNVDQVVAEAQVWAAKNLSPPLGASEIAKTAHSAWRYRGGRKQIMHQLIQAPEFKALSIDYEAMGVFSILAAENGPYSTFMIADGFGADLGWPRRLVPAARKKFLQLGLIECVRKAAPSRPALYRWTGTIAEANNP